MSTSDKPTVLLPTGYLMDFNLPRCANRVTLERAQFIGRQGRVWEPLRAVALHRRAPAYDVLHTFNVIPFARRPWLVSFESLLPRTIGRGEHRLRLVLRERLAKPNCAAIIAMSDFARREFELRCEGWSGAARALSKTTVILPNVAPKATVPRQYQPGDVLHVTFVGADWGRKGAIAAARVAEEAARRQLPIHVHIVSSLRFGFTDDPRHELYERDKQLIETHEGITFHGSIPNGEVHDLLSRSHVLLLPTVSDTFGFSVLEGFMHGLPAITTNVCALPEVVIDGENGFLLDLPRSKAGRWPYEGRRDWEVLTETWSALASATCDRLEQIVEGAVDYEEMSAAALQGLRDRHDPEAATKAMEDLYLQALD